MSNSKIQVANEFQSSTFKIIFDITTVPTLDKASDASGYVTGHTIVVDGGHLAEGI
jgi:hypothetical protein